MRAVVAACVVGLTLILAGVGRTPAPVPGDDPVVAVTVGGVAHEAVVVRMSSATTSPAHLLTAGRLLLVVLDVPNAVPNVRYANHAAALLWVAPGGSVVGFERIATGTAATLPEGARYVLIGDAETLSGAAAARSITLPATL